MENPKHEPRARLRALYPQSSDQELRVIEEKLTDYAAFVFRLYQRLASTPDDYQKLATLTARQRQFTIDRERSKNKHSPNA
jgi:hypothetical protein